jgi:peptide/nickel transport system substrate-binding protein
MHRKHLLSLFMLSMGVALLVAASLVGVASAQQKSSTICSSQTTVLCVTQVGVFDTLDPQLSYVSNDWGLLYNTELTLLNFPAKAGSTGTHLIPQGATSFPTISNGGKTYIFHIRPGLKLNNGLTVNATNFIRSFERNLSPHMYAPYGIYDGLDKFLVGGAAFAKGTASHILGLSAGGTGKLTLTIKLNKVVPQFASIMGMPWFQAIPSNMAYNNTPGGILKYASGGPYYIYSNNLNSLTVLKKNTHFPTSPYFRSNWPSNPSQIVVKSYPTSNGTPQVLQAEKSQVDLAGVASQDVASVKAKYGVNTGRFHVGPTTCITWNALNNHAFNGTTNGLAVRKALNYFLSRNQINSFAGPLSGNASDQVLVPAIPGYKKFTVYPASGSSVAFAKSVGGNMNGKHLNIYYRAASVYQTSVEEYIAAQATKLGMVPVAQTSDLTGFYHPLMTKSIAEGNGGYNITAFGGWCADYADGYDYINVNFDGRTIGDTGNTDYMYFNNGTFNKHMDAAAAKTGSARATAYGNLDKEFMTNYAPIIPTQIGNTRIVTSNRVHNWVYSSWWGQPFWGQIKLS